MPSVELHSHVIKSDAIEDSGYYEFRDALNKLQSEKVLGRVKSSPEQPLLRDFGVLTELDAESAEPHETDPAASASEQSDSEAAAQGPNVISFRL